MEHERVSMTANPDQKSKSLIGVAVKQGFRAATKIGGAVRTAVKGITQVSRFVRNNSLRGLFQGEIVLSEATLNRFMRDIKPPKGVASITLRCHPSRLVLVLALERKVLGVPLVRDHIEIPFEILEAHIENGGGLVRGRLDSEARPDSKGIIRPLVMRFLYRAAAELVDADALLARIGHNGDIIWRDGDVVSLDLDKPGFAQLMVKDFAPWRARHLPLPRHHRLEVQVATSSSCMPTSIAKT
jgi:hypothetical protein